MTATAFSWALTIGDFKFDHFGEISVSVSLPRYGENGVVTQTMNISTYSETIHSDNIVMNAEVVLSCNKCDVPKFYVISRNVDGPIIKWTCADRMSKLDDPLELGDEYFDKDDKIECSALINAVANKYGFDSVTLADESAELPGIIGKIDRTSCDGSSGRDILDMLSTAMCGYWQHGNSNDLIFLPIGHYEYHYVPYDYSPVIYSSFRVFGGLIVTDGNEIYTAGTPGSITKLTLTIDTPYASQALANQIFNSAVNDCNYYAWKCNGLAYEWMFLGALFINNQYQIYNSISLYPTSSGIFFSAQCNDVSERESEYLSAVQRKLKKKIELDRINSNMAITKKGMYFFENGYKEKSGEQSEKVKYGFEVSSGGITEYDGAMVSKVVPKSATWNADKTEAVIDYGSKKYRYKISHDGNGNVTGLSKEEITE